MCPEGTPVSTDLGLRPLPAGLREPGALVLAVLERIARVVRPQPSHRRSFRDIEPTAISGSHRNSLGEGLARVLPPERHARPSVEFVCHVVQMLLTVSAERGPFGEVLPE